LPAKTAFLKESSGFPDFFGDCELAAGFYLGNRCFRVFHNLPPDDISDLGMSEIRKYFKG
jgi:hypothetical protein